MRVIFQSNRIAVASIEELELDPIDSSLDVGDRAPMPKFGEIPVTVTKDDIPKLATRKPVAILRRVIKLGTVGQDGVAVKRALATWSFKHEKGKFKWRKHWGRVFGPVALLALRRFQKAQFGKADGQYGEHTHAALVKFFDAYGAKLMSEFHPGTSADKKRAKAVATAFYAYNRAPRCYTLSPARALGFYHKLFPPSDIWQCADCSSFVLWCYAFAGIDTAGPFDGWTGSMLEHGKRITVSQLKPGDAVFYNNHVAMYVGHGRVISHGHWGGPFLVSINYRTDIIGCRSYV